ncbi:MAG: DUF2752 domain-containing protein [Microthrixaceae bacterium]
MTTELDGPSATDPSVDDVGPGTGDAAGTTFDPHAEHDDADGHDHGAAPDWRRGARVGGVVAVGAAAIALVNPRDSGVPVCWSQGVFGVDCPLCGGLRCVNSLARGDLIAAADHNLVLAVALPVVVVAWAVWMVWAVRGRRFSFPSVPRWVWTIAAVAVVAFTVARNMDLGPFAHYLAAERG